MPAVRWARRRAPILPTVLATIACAGLVLVGALVIGQATLRLCGARSWSWLAPAVGIALMMLITVPGLHLPGRSMTAAVFLALAVLASLAFVVAPPAHLPPIAGLLGGLAVFLLALVPFAAAGHAGTLGVSFNNDMAAHLLLAEGYRSEAVAAVSPVSASYPSGPHALVGALAQGLGVGVDEAFAGLTIALMVLLGWTALGALRSPRWWGPLVTAPLVGMPFLIAGYYGQGSFKEVLEAVFMLATVVWLGFPTAVGRRLRWVPVALVLAGALSVYGHAGLVWPLAFIAIWIVGASITLLIATRSWRALLARWNQEIVPVLIACGALVAATAPQIPRLVRFFSDSVGANLTGIPPDSLGNLARRLPFWEAFGIWDSADYRVPGPEPGMNSLWISAVVSLVLFGVVWSLLRGEWLLPSATLATLLIWWATDAGQSPYVAAKALVLLTPMLMIVAVRPLVERDTPSLPMPSWWTIGAPLIAALFLFKGVGSSWDALTYSKVGPTTHIRELQSLHPLLDGRPTLYLGNDDFTPWMFAGVPVQSPVIGFPSLPFRPAKTWEYGMNYDIDSLEVATLNGVDWVVSPRDAASSAPPAQLELVRRTPHFDVYRRTATIPPRFVLAEGSEAAAPLDCESPTGRRVRRNGGVAAVRDPHVSVAAPVILPGDTATVELPLTPGEWDLVTPYGGPRPVEVTAPGLRTTLPGNLDRPGPRWPIGRIRVTRAGPVPVTMHATSEWLTSDAALTYMTSVTAVPVGSEKIVPITAACGRLVDWYRPARG